MIRYDKLFELLKSRNMQKTDLRAILSSRTIAKLSKGDNVFTDVIGKICAFLHCQPGEIMEVVPAVCEQDDLEQEIKMVNCKSVKWVLLSLNFNEYTRVVVRERMRLYPPFGGFRYLGGGYPGKVMQRYGDRLVADSCILEDALVLYLVPLDQSLSDHWGDWCMAGDRFCACSGKCCDCAQPYNLDEGVCPLDRR